MRRLRVILKEKAKKLDPVHDEEVLRRYSLLTKENVAECVKLSFLTLNNLNAYYSTRGVIHESMLFLLRLVIAVRIHASNNCLCPMSLSFAFEQVPDLEMPSSADIRRYNFETALEILNIIKNRHLEMIERARDSRLTFSVKVCAQQKSIEKSQIFIEFMFSNSMIQTKTTKIRCSRKT